MKIISTLLITLFISMQAFATSFPDSGKFLKEFNDENLRKTTSLKNNIKDEKVIENKSIDNSHEIFINGFNIYGNTKLESKHIQQLLLNYTNKNMTTSELHNVANILMSAYKKEGYFVAKVYIPPQTILNGIVDIHVYEGYLSPNGIKINNNSTNINSEKIYKLLKNTLKEKTIITSRDYERALLLSNDIPGISTKGIIYPGQEVGTADFLLEIDNEDSFAANVDYDNFGGYYTGKNRFGSTLYFNSPSKNGDQIVTRFVSTGKKSNFAYLDYNLPILDNGSKIGASLGFLKYELDKEYESKDVNGKGYDAKVYYSYPFIRSRHLNVFGEISASHTHLKDKDTSSIFSERKINSSKFRIHGDHDDDFFTSGISYFDFSNTFGNVDLDNNQAFRVYDSQTSNTQGTFAKFNFSLSRLQHLGGNFSTYIAFKGQLASKNLDSSQKFYLGGPYSLAGYPVGEISADNGLLAHIDLRYDMNNLPWGGNFQFSTFYSQGWAKLHKNTWSGWQGTSNIIENNMNLKSVGIGLSQYFTEKSVIRAMFGRQIGTNKARDPLTNDATDKSSSDYRLWLNAIYYF